MTTTAVATAKPTDRLLQIVLKTDAVAGALTGVGLVALGSLHEDLFGLPTSWSMPIGVFLLVLAATIWMVKPAQRRAVWGIVVVNLIWVASSVVVLLTGVVDLTGLGVGYVALQAAAVAALAELEIIGLRRTSR
jgi:hypothetical protein